MYFPCFLMTFSLIAPRLEYKFWVGIGIINEKIWSFEDEMLEVGMF